MGRHVEDQHADIEAAAQHGGEGGGQLVHLVPDEGVIVERIVDRDIFIEGGRDLRPWCIGSKGGKLTFRSSAMSAMRAASPPEQLMDTMRLSCSGPAMVEEFQRLDEGRDRVHAGDAVALEQRIIERVGAGER